MIDIVARGTRGLLPASLLFRNRAQRPSVAGYPVSQVWRDMAQQLTFPSMVFDKLKDRGLALRLSNTWNIIQSFPVKQRKGIVLLCRAREVIIGDPYNLLCVQTNLTTTPDDISLSRAEKQYYQLVIDITNEIKSPILSSVILDMCRSAPLSLSDIHNQKIASWGKEVSICESDESDLHFDYTCWFDPDCFSRPLIAGIPPNPRMASTIHDALLRWKDQVIRTPLYPRMSRKLISRGTIREFENLFNVAWVVEEREGGVEMTQETLEKIYHTYGVQLDGPCEIRQKWYKSGVTPRTYFTGGGTSYRKSKYIQEVAGRLTEQLSTTHPITRLNPARVRLRAPSSYLRIYDLSGFTSNHWECKHFLDRLAEWCYGDTVSIVDAREGLIEVDLGILISEYNQSMNYFAEYSLEKIAIEFAEVLEHHNRAGFLGVYGNINFSTFLHGASLLMTLSDEDEANVAGDDAHFNEEEGHEDVTDIVVFANGRFEHSKEFRSDQVGAVCLKRGIIQIDQHVLPKIMLVFPSFSNLGALFGFHPPQFARENLKGHEKLAMVGNELFRFLRGLFLANVTEDLDVAHDLLQAIYVSASLPKQGMLPPYGSTLIPALPDDPMAYNQCSPLDLLMRNHFSSGAVLPRILDSNEVDESKQYLDLVENNSWCGSKTQKLRYLEVLEYVTSSEMTEVVWGIDAYNRLMDMYAGIGTKVYEWLVVRDVPDFLCSLP